MEWFVSGTIKNDSINTTFSGVATGDSANEAFTRILDDIAKESGCEKSDIHINTMNKV